MLVSVSQDQFTFLSVQSDPVSEFYRNVARVNCRKLSIISVGGRWGFIEVLGPCCGVRASKRLGTTALC